MDTVKFTISLASQTLPLFEISKRGGVWLKGLVTHKHTHTHTHIHTHIHTHTHTRTHTTHTHTQTQQQKHCNPLPTHGTG